MGFSSAFMLRYDWSPRFRVPFSSSFPDGSYVFLFLGGKSLLWDGLSSALPLGEDDPSHSHLSHHHHSNEIQGRAAAQGCLYTQLLVGLNMVNKLIKHVPQLMWMTVTVVVASRKRCYISFCGYFLRKAI